ncbi:MAG TPA: sigma-70 family RNA polymerase sigma factor [Verrucomicrobiae bacterium]|nr:sigma-70 family RNA polymerase sigma factor [Verrucomicrobiae bacterium]
MSREAPDADARDRAAMKRLAAGHEAALDELMACHATPVFQFLCRMVGNADDANDLAQETFVRVYKSRHRFRADEKFSTWLFTIAANLARNHLRWRRRHPALSLETPIGDSQSSLGNTLSAGSPLPSESLLATERAAAVRAAIGKLPPDLREAIVLCEWEERSVAEAAAILRATPKAVESRLYRARQLLRERLKKWLN